MEQKICSNPKCGQLKDITEFSFRSKKLNTRFDYCKDCKNNYGKIWYEKNKEWRLKQIYENRVNSNGDNIYTVRNQQYIFNYLLTHHCIDCRRE